MTIWPVANVMKQDSDGNAECFLIGNFMSFESNFVNSIVHQVHCADSVMKPIVNGSGINQMRQAQLGDSSQSLKPRVIYEIMDDVVT